MPNSIGVGSLPTSGLGPAVGPLAGRENAGAQGPRTADGFDFRQALDQAGATGIAPALESPSGAPPAALKFSAHAVERMRSRGITFAPETMKKIESAVAKAAQKGSKDALVLTGESALIVSVKNATVVTVMDKSAMRENVFTNIDSAVVI